MGFLAQTVQSQTWIQGLTFPLSNSVSSEKRSKRCERQLPNPTIRWDHVYF